MFVALSLSGGMKSSSLDRNTIAEPGAWPAEDLRQLLSRGDPVFFDVLRKRTLDAGTFEAVFPLSVLRKRAASEGFSNPASSTKRIRLAIVGGCNLYPLTELVQHYLETTGERTGLAVDLFQGEYDGYVSEILDGTGPLYEFKPDVILIFPSERRCRYDGEKFASLSVQQDSVHKAVNDILDLGRIANERSHAEIILANFLLPPQFDPGSIRVRSLSSDWCFRKAVNLDLGLAAPPYLHICDVEFLSSRRGTLSSVDSRAWFENKQSYSADFLVDIAKEVTHLVSSLRKATKKVLAVDLDNTLWGGVIGDDGLEGIEIGDTSPRGEAFKEFQRYLLSLTERGILLAVCSKNDREKAIEPFEKHSEMVLRMKDFACFKANWNPKSDNLREIAAELNLGTDSIVFVDDNPAEIEIVHQFAPDVEALLLGPDPSEYVSRLKDARLFESLSITAEDTRRTQQYIDEAQRRDLLASATDMGAYLRSLEMRAVVRDFHPIDVARIAQLINKSNQFNLTTRRRTEADVKQVMEDPCCTAFTIRLADKFGDQGLIAVVIGCLEEHYLNIDTWLMSCRVLNRQVEEETVNEIVRRAVLRGCKRIRGRYIPSQKNGMVKDLYGRMGFTRVAEHEHAIEFELDPAAYHAVSTAIQIHRESYDAN